MKGTIAVLSASKDLEGSGPQGTPQMAAAARLPDWGRPSGCHRGACLAPGLGHSGNAGLRETGGRLGKVSRANADRRRRGAVARVGFSLRTARRARRANEAAESRLPSLRPACVIAAIRFSGGLPPAYPIMIRKEMERDRMKSPGLEWHRRTRR